MLPCRDKIGSAQHWTLGVAMTTADLTRDPDPEQQPALTRIDVYDEWRRREGLPLVGGVYHRDMNEIEVGPWARKGDGVRGALSYLDGDEEGDEHIVELPPGGSTAPLKHMYTEATYVLSGPAPPPCGWRAGPSRPSNGGQAATSSSPRTPGIRSSTPACPSPPAGSPSPTCRSSCACGQRGLRLQ